MNYLDYVYPKEQGNYPQMLCDYLVKRYGLKGRLLDVGAGIGNYVIAFNFWGVNAYRVDKEDCNLEKDRIPFHDESFQTVFSKSLIEHIHNTEHLLSEMYRILKPGGLAICLTPDWHTDYRMFYDDCTHVRPYTKKGLAMAFTLAEFKDVQCEEFYQLPILWRCKWLKSMAILLAIMPVSKYNGKGEQRVWIRHSKERMLLLTARRP